MTHVIPSPAYPLPHACARPTSSTARAVVHGLSLDRLGFATLVLLALSLGLGDIAQVTPVDTVLLAGVHGLLPLTIGLTFLTALRKHRWPVFPRRLSLPLAAWLLITLLSAALAPTNRAEAFAALERPVAGALLAWATYALCTSLSRWLLLARAVALGGVAIAIVGLGEALGTPPVLAWLASLHEDQVPIGDVPRLAATLSHPNVAAILLELSLPLLIAWMWSAARPWRWLVVSSALGTLLALVLTFSRAGLVAAVMSLAVMARVSIARGGRRRLVTLGFVALAVPAALLYAALTRAPFNRREPCTGRSASTWCATTPGSASAPTTTAGDSPATRASLQITWASTPTTSTSRRWPIRASSACSRWAGCWLRCCARPSTVCARAAPHSGELI